MLGFPVGPYVSFFHVHHVPRRRKSNRNDGGGNRRFQIRIRFFTRRRRTPMRIVRRKRNAVVLALVRARGAPIAVGARRYRAGSVPAPVVCARGTAAIAGCSSCACASSGPAAYTRAVRMFLCVCVANTRVNTLGPYVCVCVCSLTNGRPYRPSFGTTCPLYSPPDNTES